MMSSQPLLKVEDLEVRFYTPDGTVRAINGISYTLNEAETLAIVGESGCGKSVGVMSLLRLIPEPPGRITHGAALFQGDDLLAMDEATLTTVRGKDIAMIFQDSMTSLNPLMRIGRQIAEMLEEHKGIGRKEAMARAVELLEMVNIPDAAQRVNDYPHQFSGGMRQRVMIAMALACMPKILIADEPTTALDVTIQAQIVDLVKQLRDELGMAVIWISHDLGVVASLADRVLVMYAGYIVEEADVIELYTNAAHPYTLGLLGALPRVDRVGNGRLASVEGAPPDLIDLPPGCPFAARCQYAVSRCDEEVPPLVNLSPNHATACWVDVNTGRER